MAAVLLAMFVDGTLDSIWIVAIRKHIVTSIWYYYLKESIEIEERQIQREN